MSATSERSIPRALYAMTAVCVLGALVVVLILTLHRSPPPCAAEACEAVPVFELPTSTLRHGDSTATVVIALFVDFESAASRQVFAAITEVVGLGGLGERSELRLLHAPAGGCGADGSSYRCVAARAVECGERLSAGTGVRLAGVAFDMQWDPPAERTLESLAAKGLVLGVDAASLQRCVLEDREVMLRVEAHAAWAREQGLAAAPAGFVVHEGAGEPQRVAVFQAWLTRESLRRIVRCLVRGVCEERRS